ncbi:hypothetical protein ACFV4P_07435 [Kitasatospora sp. NPDC059795]|uniref:hypothetical protein n=1 Tax=Kitasatospora sp. NPDC059795 TaxID=3346949 RepID=UPI00365237C2
MTSIDDPEWLDNPRLNEWLTLGRDGFPAWAELTGGGWDFTTGSLPRLEQAVRGRYPDWEQANAAWNEPFLTAAAWYFGEVHVRNYGALWHCSPEPPPHAPDRIQPLLRLPKEVLDEEEAEELAEAEELYEDDFPMCSALGMVVAVADPTAAGRLLETLENYAYWDSVVDRALALAAGRPAQNPGSRPLPGGPGPLDPGRPGQDLAHWLATREEAFGLWARATGLDGRLDFSERSLGLLEDVLRRRIDTLGLGDRLDHMVAVERYRIAHLPDVIRLFEDPVFDCALWYLGETACRARGARWIPLRCNNDLDAETHPELSVARIGRRIGPRLELTAAVHRCLRDRTDPSDGYGPLREALSALD